MAHQANPIPRRQLAPSFSNPFPTRWQSPSHFVTRERPPYGQESLSSCPRLQFQPIPAPLATGRIWQFAIALSTTMMADYSHQIFSHLASVVISNPNASPMPRFARPHQWAPVVFGLSVLISAALSVAGRLSPSSRPASLVGEGLLCYPYSAQRKRPGTAPRKVPASPSSSPSVSCFAVCGEAPFSAVARRGKKEARPKCQSVALL
jgi:hypothetical protein